MYTTQQLEYLALDQERVKLDQQRMTYEMKRFSLDLAEKFVNKNLDELLINSDKIFNFLNKN